MIPLFRLQLMVLRSSLAAAMAAIDLVLSHTESTEDAPPSNATTEPVPAEGVFSLDPFKCDHPRSHWMDTPVMGNPNAKTCRCGEPIMEDKK